MILLTPGLRYALRGNAIARRSAERSGNPDPDPDPDPASAFTLFNPVGAATRLATELASDGDTLFGIVDLGFGSRELGSFSLCEIAGLRLPFALAIERDLDFATSPPPSRWADRARREGSIRAAETALGLT